MSITGQTVQNAGTTLYADLLDHKFAPGTDIIIFTLNKPGGTRNQNWRFIPVNPDQNLYNIQSVLTALYASVDSTAVGQVVKSSLTAFTWQVTVVDTGSPNWIIKVPNTNLVWNVPSGSPVRTKLTIDAYANNSTNQQWKFTNV